MPPKLKGSSKVASSSIVDDDEEEDDGVSIVFGGKGD